MSDRACRPSLEAPNLALNLEICDYVNAKQGSAPREAAIAVVKLINQRDPQTSELAIALLDNLVKNCGYPFQLQISRKEFLNELVKTFPEKFPLRYSRTHRLILAQIEEWYQTICKTSKYKEDFGYIRDMHRLLSNKGYVFPEVKLEDAAVLNPSDNLKSMEELQKEEAVVHSAKLQELVRRGRPQDLQEANKLMKIMAGFKEENVEENKKRINDDIARLRRKIEILAEMLESIQSSGSSLNDSNEASGELYGSIKSSQPNITKLIEEDNDNDERVNELLALNDSINSVISKYQLLKNGEVEQASQIKIASGGGTNGGDLNLIDFDDEAPISDNQNDNQGYNDLLSDLSNLTFSNNNNSNNFGSGGLISLGGNKTQGGNGNIQQPQPSSVFSNTSSNLDLLSGLNSPSPQLQSNTTRLDPFGLNFPSSTPSQVQVKQEQYKSTISIFESPELTIDVAVLNTSSPSEFSGRALFGNPLNSQVSQFRFMLAAAKSCKLSLQPQTSESIAPFSKQAVSQDFKIENPSRKNLKVKWKVEYVINNQNKEQSGVSILES